MLSLKRHKSLILQDFRGTFFYEHISFYVAFIKKWDKRRTKNKVVGRL